MNKRENVKQRKRRNNETELKRIYNINTTDSSSPLKNINKRERLYSKVEPRLLEDQLMVKGRRKQDFETFIDKLKDFASYSRSREMQIIYIGHSSCLSD